MRVTGSIVKVLVVDDFEPWCCVICSMLQKEPGLQVVGEVSDGLEAVQRARELQPDLILLNVGLPSINGIEAARRIREASPTTKILFVSEGSSPDVAEAALGTGARGYVIKSDAGTELLPAVEAILRGEWFISASLNERAEDGIEKTKMSFRLQVPSTPFPRRRTQRSRNPSRPRSVGMPTR